MGDLVAAVPPSEAVPLLLRPHPYSADPGYVLARPGQTIAEMLSAAAGGADLAPLQVRVGGYEVPAELWDRVRPKQGSVIEVTGIPGSGMNDNWRAVLMIVVAIVAWYVAPYLGGTWGLSEGAWAGLLTMAGNMMINALVKPPSAEGDETTRKWNQLTGNSNQINPGGPIPHILGEARFFPPHAAMPYSIAYGGHSYQYCLFDLGYNVEEDDVDMDSATIGSTPLSAYEGVQYQIGTNPDLYKNDTAQTYIGVDMKEDDEVIRTTALGTELISIDMVAPQGYYAINDKGKKFSINMYFDVYYRPTGTSTWLEIPFPIMANLKIHPGSEGMYTKTFSRRYEPTTFGIKWEVPAGQYDVRVVRRYGGHDGGNATLINMVVLNSMLSVRQVPASRTGTLKLAMRIRADNQLNGTLQSFSLMVRPKYPVYDEDTDTWTRERTTNAAWLYHYLMTACPDTARKVAPERMNLPQILDYADFCERHELETRLVLDATATVGQVVDMLLRTSGGERTMTDGKYGVTFLPDDEPLAPAPFAPTEVKDFTLHRNFVQIPHALRVKFRNPLANWQDDEIIVLDDGFSYRGVDARGEESEDPEPTIFEELDLRATMLPQQAWRLARMHFAQAKFSNGTYTWQSDIAALKLTKGSPCEVAHDVPEWGTGAGRVVSLEVGGPAGVGTLVLDTELDTDPGKTYRMQIRSPESTQVVNVLPHSPRTATFYLGTWPSGVEPGDVAILGENDVEKPILLVTHMRANADLEFTVSAVAWDPRIAPYWADPPEDMVSEISGRPYTEPPDPPIVVIGDGNEDDDTGTRTPITTIWNPNRPGGGGHIDVDVFQP